jgi:hypothetical protein
MISMQQNLGRLEGKMDLVVQMVGETKMAAEKIHHRIDTSQREIQQLREAQIKIRKDMKWVVAIGLAFITGIKWLLVKLRVLWVHN